MRRICLFSDDFYSARPHTCGVFNILMFCLSSRRWFVLCLACISYLMLVHVSGAVSVGPQLSKFHLKTEPETSLRNVVFLNKIRMMDNVQKHNICIPSIVWHSKFSLHMKSFNNLTKQMTVSLWTGAGEYSQEHDTSGSRHDSSVSNDRYPEASQHRGSSGIKQRADFVVR
jgi:hypothetical protein